MRSAKLIRLFIKSVLIASPLFLIFVFGCGPAPTAIVVLQPTNPGEPAPITESIATQPVATQPAPTIESTVSPTAAAPGTVIKLFLNAPLSGDHGTSGQDILHGASLAVEQLSGPLLGPRYQVELVSYDDQNTREMALLNAQAIAADPEILCGVGHLDPEITIAASDIYHMAGLALISPSNTVPLLTDRSYLEINRLIARADRQGHAAAQFAQAQGYKSVFIVGQKAENSVRNAEHFRVESGKLGIKWLGSAIESINELNMNRIVDKIVRANPDLLYVSTSARQAIPLLTELRAKGYMGAVLATDRLDSPTALREAGEALVQGGGLYYTILNPHASYYPGATSFIQDFTTRYETKPRLYAARAYDAIAICLQGIQEAAKASGDLPPTRVEVARAIRALKDYHGITGTYSFNRQGDPNPMQYYIYQVVSVDEANWDQNPIVASYTVALP